jgi:hypothetical protein
MKTLAQRFLSAKTFTYCEKTFPTEKGKAFLLKHANDAKTQYDWKGDRKLFVFNDGSKIEHAGHEGYKVV